jgi:hypothetical protein
VEDNPVPANLAQLRVDGLTSLQLAELRAAIWSAGSDDVKVVESPTLGGGKLGEPALLTVILTLGPSAIAAISLWLAKRKKGRSKNLKYTKIDPNGSVESFELEESSYDEGASSAAAIQAFLEKKLGQ